MTIQLFVADGAWDIAQVVSATRAGSNVVYEALIPWVFLAGFGMLVYEAFKVYQGNTASITGATKSKPSFVRAARSWKNGDLQCFH
jgi:hypothetical protein